MKLEGLEFSPQQLAHVAKRGTPTRISTDHDVVVVSTDALHKVPVVTLCAGRIHQIGGPLASGKEFEAIMISKFLLKLAPEAPEVVESPKAVRQFSQTNSAAERPAVTTPRIRPLGHISRPMGNNPPRLRF